MSSFKGPFYTQKGHYHSLMVLTHNSQDVCGKTCEDNGIATVSEDGVLARHTRQTWPSSAVLIPHILEVTDIHPICGDSRRNQWVFLVKGRIYV